MRRRIRHDLETLEKIPETMRPARERLEGLIASDIERLVHGEMEARRDAGTAIGAAIAFFVLALATVLLIRLGGWWIAAAVVTGIFAISCIPGFEGAFKKVPRDAAGNEIKETEKKPEETAH